MKKIILIEDRPKRQTLFLGDNNVKKLESIENLYLPKEDKCRLYMEKINSNEIEELKEYDMILIHRSSLKREGLENIEIFCKEESKDLILFSGGNSQYIYSNEPYQNLTINSKDFYSENLIGFITNYINGNSESLLELIYKSNWKLGEMMKYRLLNEKYHQEKDIEIQIEIEDKLNMIKETLSLQRNNNNYKEEIDRNIEKIIKSL
ncbi:hypothetical protein KRX57_04785 [Weeksellaceae bacterium TAE3-ERU29]|nr:hypothetical protein [Weeksellaceae bacterium TAE3-ERU29]